MNDKETPVRECVKCGEFECICDDTFTPGVTVRDLTSRCSDCPPEDWTTDTTRCAECPRTTTCATCAGQREIRDDTGGQWTCYVCSPSTQLAIYTKADVEALIAIALAAERKFGPQNRVANLNKEVLEALERFVRAEKAWMDAKAPMEERAPGTFEDPLSDAYSHAVAVLNKLPRCHHLGPRVPMIHHERPTCGLFEGHGGDHSARCLNGQWLCWPHSKP